MSREAMKRIKTWNERCEEHPDHQQGMISERMIQERMQEEIDELRQVMQENEELRQGLARMAALYEKAANDRDALFEKYVASAIRARGEK